MTVLSFNQAIMPPDSPKSDDFAAAMRVLTVLADAPASKKLLTKLSESAAEAREQIAKAEETLAELDRKTAIMDARAATVDDDLAKLRNEHEKRLDDERRNHEQDIAGRLKALEQREKAVAAADEKYLALNADLERRLAAIKKAAS